MNRKKVGVVVLTYNRLQLLKITISKILEQSFEPAEILIVDNNSSDGTREYLEESENLSTIFLNENLGPAGGFYEGIKYFSEKANVDYVWLMDDDFFPFPSCLEILLQEASEHKVLYPFVREKDLVSRKKPAWWGVLIPMNIIKEVGYPRKDLFFWAEDTEYLQGRIEQQFHFKSEWIPAAKGVHFTKRVKGYRRPWQYYYETRNSIYSRLYIKKRTPKRIYKIFRTWVKLFANIIVRENQKLYKIKWFLKGTYDGVFRNLGKRKGLHRD